MNIGIIGGGQLGMMMAEAAVHLGHNVFGLDPNPDCSLSRLTTDMITAEYDDIEAVKALMDKSDVVTYEFENVDLALIEQFITKVPQKSQALRVSKNRILEKEFAHSLSIRIPKFVITTSKEDIFVPSILKTATGGYDGKGQHVFLSKSEIDRFSFNPSVTYICEEYIDFDYEISVIATRNQLGSVVYYPIPKNVHRKGILFTSTVVQNIPLNVIKNAKMYTRKIMNELDYVGTLAVEFFVKNGAVIFNEFAPRPHNSGHYTIEGCNVSQFENHIRAITGDTLIEPTLLAHSVMLNVIGKKPFKPSNIDINGVFIHDYYKRDLRDKRKMGHITIMHNDLDELDKIINQYIEAYYG